MGGVTGGVDNAGDIDLGSGGQLFDYLFFNRRSNINLLHLHSSWLKNPLPPPLDEGKGIEGVFRGLNPPVSALAYLGDGYRL